MIPRARKDGLMVQEVGDELLVYDEERKHAHRLNRTAALVWRACDGTRTVAEIAASLREGLNPVADEDLVWLALDQLDAFHLLEEPIKRPPEQVRISRRRVVRRLGLTGVLSLLLPAIITLALPTPAMADSCTNSSSDTETFATITDCECTSCNNGH
jgi:Coenzyme PQQ synthesis protein D (PqqD)